MSDRGGAGDGAVPDGTEVLRPPSAARDRPMCPTCRTPGDAGARFCEHCGQPLVTAPDAAPQRAGWVATVAADRTRYDVVAPDGLAFPRGREPVELDVTSTIVIGRSRSQAETPPGIDLAGPLADPAVSRRHASLVVAGDGLTLVDHGSTNGTTVNDDPTPIERDVPVRLADGDRIHLGAWTTITVRRRRSAS